MVPKFTVPAADQRTSTGSISTLLSAWNSSGNSNGSRASTAATNFPLQVKAENYGIPDNVDFSNDYSPLFSQTFGNFKYC